MIRPRFISYVMRQVRRRPARSLLTIAGVAAAMFLFGAVQAVHEGVREATSAAAGDATLVVYRQNRFCPFSSRLPEHYQSRLERIAGVRSVTPIKVVVNNCRVGLDVITFRGIPEDAIAEMTARATLLDGSINDWNARSDAALVSEDLAARRGVRVGDSFEAAGVSVVVAGIFRSDQPQDRYVAYVHLPFIQQASKHGGLGIVTQFNVAVDDPARLAEVAAAIDDEFRHDPEPTFTTPEKAFVARTAADIIDIVAFTRYLGWACLALVLALIANAIVLSVQDRVAEHAVLQTLGFRGWLIARLILCEGLVLSLAGGAAGLLGVLALEYWGRFSLSVEGVTIAPRADRSLLMIGLLIAAGLGVAAGLFPAWRASRREIAACFRAV